MGSFKERWDDLITAGEGLSETVLVLTHETNNTNQDCRDLGVPQLHRLLGYDTFEIAQQGAKSCGIGSHRDDETFKNLGVRATKWGSEPVQCAIAIGGRENNSSTLNVPNHLHTLKAWRDTLPDFSLSLIEGEFCVILAH